MIHHDEPSRRCLVLRCSGELWFDRYSPEKSSSEPNLRTAARSVRFVTPWFSTVSTCAIALLFGRFLLPGDTPSSSFTSLPAHAQFEVVRQLEVDQCTAHDIVAVIKGVFLVAIYDFVVCNIQATMHHAGLQLVLWVSGFVF